MKRRLTLAILGTVAAALLIAGVGTLLLARVGARESSEEELRAQAESTANLVSFGQARFGQLSTADTETLRATVCRPQPTTTTTSAALPVIERLKDSLCAPSIETTINATKAELCDASPAARQRLEATLSNDMRAARDTFCANPDAANLDKVRVAYCNSAPAPSGASTAARRRAEQVQRSVCRSISVRAESRGQLESTLSKESIDLVVFGPDNQLVQGDLPGNLTPESIRPELLRTGEVTSGPIGNGAYAAAAVESDQPIMEVIVIARPSDPVRGLVPWFLLASGITMAIGIVVATLLGRALTNPLREAQKVTAEIAHGDLSARLPEKASGAGHPRDELEALAHSINSMAAALERSRGLERQFLLSVSHDLRTPLTSISGYAEAISDGAAIDPERAAGIILAESRRLERLVKDLLDLAKLDARGFTFALIDVDLNEIASDSVDGFRREVEAAGMSLRLDVAPGPVLARVDPDRLQQVIANLMENALKFATNEIVVRVSADPSSIAAGQVAQARIEVVDDGPGIPAADLPHVFERLYVTTAVPVRKEAGSGLGLAIVREITEAMGGSVEALANPPGQSGVRMVLRLVPVTT